MKTLPSIEYLRECFEYFPNTGEIRWKTRPSSHFKHQHREAIWNAKYPGRTAGGKSTAGHLQIRICNATHRAHRIIWALSTGAWPTLYIDHINGIVTDNRIENLREATPADNSKNAKRREDNSSGITGVGWNKSAKKWQVRIKNNGASIYLGVFDRLADARVARKNAERTLGYHENHGRAQ